MDKEVNSLSDEAYKKVREMIVNRKLSGGDVLVESRLAAAVGATRTPLREALVRLEGAGFLVKRKGRSFAVRQVSASEFFQSLRVRQYLESKAAGLAIDKVDVRTIKEFQKRIRNLLRKKVHGPEQWKLDDDLHSWLAAAGGNKVLEDHIRQLRSTTQLFEIGRPFDRAEADAQEHLAILQAITEKDRKATEACVLQHLKNIEKDVLATVSGA